MTSFDWLWKAIFLWFCFIYHLQFAGVHGVPDVRCLTRDGGQGLCVTRKYCREPFNQSLGASGAYVVCCPPNTAEPPSSSNRARRISDTRTTEAPIRVADHERLSKPKEVKNEQDLNYRENIIRRPPTTSPRPDFKQPDPRKLPQVPECGIKPYCVFNAEDEISKDHEWPWMAAIFQRSKNSKTLKCGGSLINTRYVLTAAHCFVTYNTIQPASDFVVRLGSNAPLGGEEFEVSDIVPYFNHSKSEDFNAIALVRLSREVVITGKIAPICLLFGEMLQESFDGRQAVVAGWGMTSLGLERDPPVLKHVPLSIVSSEKCAAAYLRLPEAEFLVRENNHIMCAKPMEGGKDGCMGFSGSPLMLKSQDNHWRMVGIVSLGYKCGEPGYPGVYTRVSDYMHWIEFNVRRDSDQIQPSTPSDVKSTSSTRRPSSTTPIPDVKTPNPIDPLNQLPQVPGCGRKNSSRRSFLDRKEIRGYLLGGHDVREHWPWMVAIYLSRNGSRPIFQCGGSLITNRHVLTAAHCFDTRIPVRDKYSVLLGTSNITKNFSGPAVSSSGEFIDVLTIRIHEQYIKYEHYHDIALLTLVSRATPSELVHPVCMPSPEYLNSHEYVTLTGWGRTEFSGGYESKMLQEVELQIVNASRCQQAFEKFKPDLPQGITSDMICAGGSSQGDAGGPLVIKNGDRWIQVGIVSFGVPGNENYPGVSTKVSAYIGWINRILSEYQYFF